MKTGWVIAIATVGVLCGGGLLVAGVNSATSTLPVAEQETPGEIVGSASATAAKKAAPAASSVVTVKSGEWLVGKEIPAGTYRTAGADDNGVVLYCYWTIRQSDDSAAHYLDSGAVDSKSEPGRVTVKKGNVFKTSGCKAWVKQ